MRRAVGLGAGPKSWVDEEWVKELGTPTPP